MLHGKSDRKSENRKSENRKIINFREIGFVVCVASRVDGFTEKSKKSEIPGSENQKIGKRNQKIRKKTTNRISEKHKKLGTSVLRLVRAVGPALKSPGRSPG